MALWVASSRVAPVAVLVAFGAAGCEQGLAGHPCPCSDGWSCSPASNQCVEGAATQLIDDMQNIAADGPGMNGYWYTYSDRTLPNSLPVQYVSDAGFVSPSEDSLQFDTSSDGDGPIIGDVVQPYRRIEAGGETGWGVGFGMDFVVAEPDGGRIPVDECDAGEIWDGGNIPQPFDASGWTGIQFYARSFGDNEVSIQIHVDDDRTTPWGQVPFAAGGCNACISSGADAQACSDSFSDPNRADTKPVYFPAAGWTLIRVPFATLRSGNWANILPDTAPIHANKIYNLHFQFSRTTEPSVPSFSVGVALISFYKS
jgi:hypothetical protein